MEQTRRREDIGLLLHQTALVLKYCELGIWQQCMSNFYIVLRALLSKRLSPKRSEGGNANSWSVIVPHDSSGDTMVLYNSLTFLEALVFFACKVKIIDDIHLIGYWNWELIEKNVCKILSAITR